MKNHGVEQSNEAMLQVKLEIQEDLFRTLSLHIHDNVGQQLSLSKLYLKSMEPCLSKDTREQVSNVRQLISGCISDLREIAAIFSSETAKHMGLADKLRRQVSMIRKTGHLQIQLEIAPEFTEPGEKVSLVVFRMVQECLFNVLDNALATAIDIRCYSTNHYWCVDVRDNRKKQSPPFEGVPARLEKKATLIGAHVYTRYEPKKGLCFKIALPITKLDQ